MQELLRNAVNGWTDYITDGKYAVLFLGSVLYIGYSQYKDRRQLNAHSWLWGYAVLAASLVMIPLTAVLLMCYQTRFYDYVWLWVLVPVTPVIAYGGTVFYFGSYQDFVKKQNGENSTLFGIVLAAVGLVMILLCGNIDRKVWTDGREAKEMEETALLLDYLTENGKNPDICLYGPRVVMEYARSVNGSVKLLYGRNMWETSLAAYSYDTYDEAVTALYEWMEELDTAVGLSEESYSDEAVQVYVETAILYGADYLILPQEAGEGVCGQTASALAAVTGRLEAADTFEGYYIFALQTD